MSLIRVSPESLIQVTYLSNLFSSIGIVFPTMPLAIAKKSFYCYRVAPDARWTTLSILGTIIQHKLTLLWVCSAALKTYQPCGLQDRRIWMKNGPVNGFLQPSAAWEASLFGGDTMIFTPLGKKCSSEHQRDWITGLAQQMKGGVGTEKVLKTDKGCVEFLLSRCRYQVPRSPLCSWNRKLHCRYV